jgi:hypothetical protein
MDRKHWEIDHVTCQRMSRKSGRGQTDHGDVAFTSYMIFLKVNGQGKCELYSCLCVVHTFHDVSARVHVYYGDGATLSDNLLLHGGPC